MHTPDELLALAASDAALERRWRRRVQPLPPDHPAAIAARRPDSDEVDRHPNTIRQTLAGVEARARRIAAGLEPHPDLSVLDIDLCDELERASDTARRAERVAGAFRSLRSTDAGAASLDLAAADAHAIGGTVWQAYTLAQAALRWEGAATTVHLDAIVDALAATIVDWLAQYCVGIAEQHQAQIEATLSVLLELEAAAGVDEVDDDPSTALVDDVMTDRWKPPERSAPVLDLIAGSLLRAPGAPQARPHRRPEMTPGAVCGARAA